MRRTRRRQAPSGATGGPAPVRISGAWRLLATLGTGVCRPRGSVTHTSTDCRLCGAARAMRREGCAVEHLYSLTLQRYGCTPCTCAFGSRRNDFEKDLDALPQQLTHELGRSEVVSQLGQSVRSLLDEKAPGMKGWIYKRSPPWRQSCLVIFGLPWMRRLHTRKR
jgi:hypothetical protein